VVAFVATFSTLSPPEAGSELTSLSFDTSTGSLVPAFALGSSYYTDIGLSKLSSSSEAGSEAPWSPP